MPNNEMTIEKRVDSLETKFEMFMRLQDERFNNFMREMSEFKQEMRDRDNQRATEIQELRQRQDAAQAKHEDDMRIMNKKIDDKFDKLSDQLHTMTIAAVVGFGAIAVAIGGLVVSALK